MYKKYDKVEVVSDPYNQMLGDKIVGEKATVTSDGEQVLGLKFDNGMRVACWLVEDNLGCPTIKKV
jgi:hypothetical protein